jgi:hydroxymethylglutaryl-CoA reductase
MADDYGSRISGFYRLSLLERRRQVGQRATLSEDAGAVWDSGGLAPITADKIVENVLGVYALPFGVVLNVLLNGRDYLAPVVVEEPSVIAAASNAARMIRDGGGFHAELDDELMTAQVQLFDVPDAAEAQAVILAQTPRLLVLAANAVPTLVRRGGGPRHLEVRALGAGLLVVHVHIDCLNAMGANLVNTVAEALGPSLAELSRGKLGLRILTNLCDRRKVRVSARVNAAALPSGGASKSSNSSDEMTPGVNGSDIIDAIVQASRFAEADPYRAATHNKGVMNGIDSVVIATGNDYRAVEAGAHAYAARSGCYRPLATWWREGEQLVGCLELPLALGIVGGTLRVHPAARLALEMTSVRSAGELAQLAAAVGLASNLAALRALATEGIQRGHMALHARSVASAAGAVGDEVESIAAHITAQRNPSLHAAKHALENLRASALGAAAAVESALDPEREAP